MKFLTRLSRLKEPKTWRMALLVTFAIFVYSCTTDYMRDSSTSTHLPKNPPRPAYAKNISEAEARTAGPLEIPFCPDCPKDLYFGDSPETVTAKLGREPVKVKEHPTQQLIGIVYETGPFNNFPYGLLTYAFKEKRLYAIVIMFSISLTDCIASHNDLQDTLVQKHGEPSTFIQYDGLPPSQKPYPIKFWELPQNALLAYPPLATEDDDELMLAFRVDMLRADGDYEINDFKKF